jgi:hypothetical protein
MVKLIAGKTMINRKSSTKVQQRGASDMSLVIMALGAAIIFSTVIQFNSCVRDYNRKRRGWVEVPADYPYETYKPERPRGGHIDDY